MRSRLLLTLCATTCLTAPAAAESWYNLPSTYQVISYADADSISRNGNLASVNILFSHESGDYHTQTIELECAGRQYRILGAADLGSSRQYLSTPAFDSSWRALDQSMAGFQTFACSSGLRDNFVSDPFADADEYWDYMYYYYGL